jgi:hypothetical protein
MPLGFVDDVSDGERPPLSGEPVSGLVSGGEAPTVRSHSQADSNNVDATTDPIGGVAIGGATYGTAILYSNWLSRPVATNSSICG